MTDTDRKNSQAQAGIWIVILVAIVGWVATVGIAMGKLDALEKKVDALSRQLEERTLTRTESDAIHHDLFNRDDINTRKIEALEERVRLLELRRVAK